jgi:hypothetical protein
VLLMHYEANNGDGGVVLVFERHHRRWTLQEMSRLRYCHEPARTVFADKLAALTG